MTKPPNAARDSYCDLSLSRGSFDIDIAFQIPTEGVLGIFGASGSGKTSILRCIAGLEPNVKGKICIDGSTWLDHAGQTVPAHQRRVGYVFQDSRLFPHLNVNSNLLYGHSRRSTVNSPVDFDEVLALLDIAPLLNRKPTQLSGGESQRVAIARALLSDPAVLLFDEPLASLDESRKQEVLPFLDRLHKSVRVPMIYVSHSVQEVQRLCDRLILMNSGKKTYEGDVLSALGQSDIALNGEIEVGALLDGRVTQYESSTGISDIALPAGQTLHIPSRLTPNTPVSIRINASDVSLSLDKPTRTTVLNILDAYVTEDIVFGEHYVVVTLKVADQKILARVSRKSWLQLELSPKQKVFAQVKAASINDTIVAV